MHIKEQPKLSVDIIIKYQQGIVLIERKFKPFGWGLPGGFIDYGESAENAAIREAKEETNLDVKIERQFHVYSDPKRDKRAHIITIVFIAKGKGELKSGDDAKDIKIYTLDNIPDDLVDDHNQILRDFREKKY
jgi:ADP-ribose pyrophosphatase YjhB (NUDIX family)